MNLLQDTTALALAMCEKYIEEKGTAVDCTCGRGFDTLWLAGRCRKVYSFDIQTEALESAKALLTGHGIQWTDDHRQTGKGVIFICDSHENIKEYVHEAPQVVLFNLGYLPGGDKSVTTDAAETVGALQNALDLLAIGGIISTTMYPGHPQGAQEQEKILWWARTLDKSKYHCVYANMLNQKETAPQILWITKKK